MSSRRPGDSGADSLTPVAEGGAPDFQERADSMEDAALQRVIGDSLKSYVKRRVEGRAIAPYLKDHLTATEVVVVATELLEAAGLELVDLSMWRGLGSKPSTGDETNDK